MVKKIDKDKKKLNKKKKSAEIVNFINNLKTIIKSKLNKWKLEKWIIYQKS